MSVAAPDCKCGKATEKREVKDKTKKNFGKWFYGCAGNSRKGELNCGYFKFVDVWESEAKSGNTVYPTCDSCGLECRKYQSQQENENKGQWFFVCPSRSAQDRNHTYKWEEAWIKERKGQQNLDKFMKPAKPERRSRSKSPSKKREESPLREREREAQ